MSTPRKTQDDLDLPRRSLGGPICQTENLSASDKVNVVVTTAEHITMLDDPTYENIIGLRNKIESFLALGTAVKPMNHLTPNCKRVMQTVLFMHGHVLWDDWDSLSVEDFFRVLTEIFPKITEMAGQSMLEYLAHEAPNFEFNVLDQTKLVKQFVLVETTLDTINHDANDMAFAIRQLTNDITKGIGSDKVKKFIQEGIKRL